MEDITNLRMRQTLAKLQFERKMLDLELEDTILHKMPPCKTCPELDDYCDKTWDNRIETLKVKARGVDIEIEFLKFKISSPKYR